MGVAEFEEQEDNSLGAGFLDPLKQLISPVAIRVVFAGAGDPLEQAAREGLYRVSVLRNVFGKIPPARAEIIAYHRNAGVVK